MVARGNFRHDAAIDRVQVDLAVQSVRKQALFGANSATPVSSQLVSSKTFMQRIIPLVTYVQVRLLTRNRSPTGFAFANRQIRRYHTRLSPGPVPGLFMSGRNT